MIYYLILFPGVFLGQGAAALFWSFVFQYNNQNIDYWKAVHLYFKKQKGSIVLVLFVTLIIMFILSEWINLKVTKEELLLKDDRSTLENVQLKFKTAVVLWGTFAETFIILFFKGTANAIKNFGKSKGIDLNITTDEKNLN